MMKMKVEAHSPQEESEKLFVKFLAFCHITTIFAMIHPLNSQTQLSSLSCQPLPRLRMTTLDVAQLSLRRIR